MENLKELRKSKNISQQQLGELMGTSQQSIYKYEKGLSQPDIDTLIAIANFFETSVDYLIGNTTIPRKIEYLVETELNESELAHIRAYRNASPKIREIIDNLLDECKSKA